MPIGPELLVRLPYLYLRDTFTAHKSHTCTLVLRTDIWYAVLRLKGYLGGDIFYAVEKKFPDFEYTLLVRNEERAKPVKARYPNAKFVYGDLNDAAIIEKAAAEADIVIREYQPTSSIPTLNPIHHTSDCMSNNKDNQPHYLGGNIELTLIFWGKIDTANSADDIPSAKAIAKGLASGHSAENPGYWLHICGTGILMWVRLKPIYF